MQMTALKRIRRYKILNYGAAIISWFVIMTDAQGQLNKSSIIGNTSIGLSDGKGFQKTLHVEVVRNESSQSKAQETLGGNQTCFMDEDGYNCCTLFQLIAQGIREKDSFWDTLCPFPSCLQILRKDSLQPENIFDSVLSVGSTHQSFGIKGGAVFNHQDGNGIEDHSVSISPIDGPICVPLLNLKTFCLVALNTTIDSENHRYEICTQFDLRAVNRSNNEATIAIQKLCMKINRTDILKRADRNRDSIGAESIQVENTQPDHQSDDHRNENLPLKNDIIQAEGGQSYVSLTLNESITENKVKDEEYNWTSNSSFDSSTLPTSIVPYTSSAPESTIQSNSKSSAPIVGSAPSNDSLLNRSLSFSNQSEASSTSGTPSNQSEASSTSGTPSNQSEASSTSGTPSNQSEASSTSGTPSNQSEASSTSGTPSNQSEASSTSGTPSNQSEASSTSGTPSNQSEASSTSGTPSNQSEASSTSGTPSNQSEASSTSVSSSTSLNSTSPFTPSSGISPGSASSFTPSISIFPSFSTNSALPSSTFTSSAYTVSFPSNSTSISPTSGTFSTFSTSAAASDFPEPSSPIGSEEEHEVKNRSSSTIFPRPLPFVIASASTSHPVILLLKSPSNYSLSNVSTASFPNQNKTEGQNLPHYGIIQSSSYVHRTLNNTHRIPPEKLIRVQILYINLTTDPRLITPTPEQPRVHLRWGTQLKKNATSLPPTTSSSKQDSVSLAMTKTLPTTKIPLPFVTEKVPEVTWATVFETNGNEIKSNISNEIAQDGKFTKPLLIGKYIKENRVVKRNSSKSLSKRDKKLVKREMPEDAELRRFISDTSIMEKIKRTRAFINRYNFENNWQNQFRFT